MKNLLIFLITCLLFGSVKVIAQEDSSSAPYVRFPNIPQFTIFNARDSSTFTREQLKKKKNTVIILFSPECEHCQHETKELEANIDKFKNTQIVMVTYLSYAQMEKFYNDYHISNYPTITMGRDAKYFFPIFYKLRNMPSIFVYDKKGKLKKSFEGSVAISKILKEL